MTFARMSPRWVGVTLGLLTLLQAGATSPSERRAQLRNLPESNTAARAFTSAATPGASALYLVQFSGRLRPEWRRQLENAGANFVRYVPHDAFIVRLREAGPDAVAAAPFVRSVVRYGPALKLDSRVAARGGGRVRLLLAADADGRQWVEAWRQFQGGARRVRLRQGGMIEGEIKPGGLARLAASEAVLWVEPAAQPHLCDEIATKIVGGDDGVSGTRSLAQQLGFDGGGVTVAVADSGLNNGDKETMHPDLLGRVSTFFQYGQLENAADEHSHGTHVTGIIAGNGAVGETDENGYLYGLGVAPAAGIVAQRIFDGVGNYEAPPSFETLTRDAVRAGASVGSNSWGDDTQGRYDLSAAEFDGLVRDADALRAGDQPYILEFSAGNAGPAYQTVGSPAVAKNVIATGASQNDRPEFLIYSDGSDSMADFSSRGPCEDGRIKPDLVAPGTWIASLKSASATDENAWSPISEFYLYQGGTSQAGPQVSGAAAAFVQYYRQTHGGTNPSPALVKAAFINSAVDMEDGFTAAVPNNDEGWGRVDLETLLVSGRRFEFEDQAQPLSFEEMAERRVVVARDDEPLRITLAYTDVPGFPAAIPALVNDLDLEVVAPDGRVYRGNQFADGESIPDPLVSDSANNVEGVALARPAIGEYLVRVRARNVVEDARVDTGPIDQDFALVVSGAIPDPGVGVLFFDRGAYTVPDLIHLKLVDPGLAGQASVPVRVASDTEPAGETITLLSVGASGAFTNQLLTATNAAATEGRLSVANGDALTAEYQDADPAQLWVAHARADLLPPSITSVSATNALGKVQISWHTDEPATGIVRYGTNGVLNRAVTNSILTELTTVGVPDAIAGLTYQYLVEAADEAGNRRTNDNGGARFTFVALPPKTALVVDAYSTNFLDLLGIPAIPVTSYTGPLDQTGVSYEVWDVYDKGEPTLSDLKPFRVVIWRINDDPLVDDYPSPVAQSLLQQYVAGGGGLFYASMETLDLVSDAFRTNVLQVASVVIDAGAPEAVGVAGDPVGDGLDLFLDYTIFENDLLPDFNPDASDHLVPTTNAAPIFEGVGGEGIVGVRSPRHPSASDGRVVFLSFAWDAIPEAAEPPNSRADVLRRALSFLAPGADGLGSVSLDRPAYTLPALVSVEVGDSDLSGAGSLLVTARSDAYTNGVAVTLVETPRRGVFQGSFLLVTTNNAAASGQLPARNGDGLQVEYFDAGANHTVVSTALVDIQPPTASAVEAVPDYESAVVSWETSEPTEGLVQFGESTFLERTAYDPNLSLYHEVTLTGLRPDRSYYFQVTSLDAAGNATVTQNAGQLFTFRTLKPLAVPWADQLETGATNWNVYNSESGVSGWELGTPANGSETAAHSPVNAWGSNLNGQPSGQSESFLISPALELSGGNVFKLRFWHSYDFQPRSEFDILEFGQVLLAVNDVATPVTLAEFGDDATPGWEEVEVDLSAYAGKVVYLVWYYVCFSLEDAARPGWLVDDIAVTVDSAVQGTLVVNNNLSQARFSLVGPSGRSGAGLTTTYTNLPFGDYTVVFQEVPYYVTPLPQTNHLDTAAPVVVNGLYTFADANTNGISDAWEQKTFGSVDPLRAATTDTDHDGASDLAEFAAGTDPLNAASIPQVPPPQVAGDNLQFIWPTVRGRAYQLQACVDWVHWVPVTDWFRASGPSMVTAVPVADQGQTRFYRLAIQP